MPTSKAEWLQRLADCTAHELGAAIWLIGEMRRVTQGGGNGTIVVYMRDDKIVKSEASVVRGRLDII
jgi:hypothetical protein